MKKKSRTARKNWAQEEALLNSHIFENHVHIYVYTRIFHFTACRF